MKMNTVYLSTLSHSTGIEVSVCEFDAEGIVHKIYPLRTCRNQVNHPSTGFTSAFQVHHPAPLALAILDHHLSDLDAATDLYEEFESDLITHLSGKQNWILFDKQIDSHIDAIRARRSVGDAGRTRYTLEPISLVSGNSIS
jgi:Family of unknown function (DUF6166)